MTSTAADKRDSIVKRIRGANKPGSVIRESAVFKAEMEELERLGMHPAWAHQIDAELRDKK